jgi:hypothetical protein
MTMSESHSLDRRSAACLALLILLLWNDRGDAYQGNTFFVNGTIVDEAGGPVFQANLTLERFGSIHSAINKCAQLDGT